MLQRWDRLTFIHWQYEPSAIRNRLPEGLAPDLWDGHAWVSMTPFQLQKLRPPFTPALPWLSHFPETNLRTYVRNARGEPGIWFFSLEAARLAAVLGARVTYGLPYMWSRMSISQRGAVITYKGTRKWPGPVGAGYEIAIETGSPIAPRDLRGFDHFVTARWRLYSRFADRLAHAEVEHPPWPLTFARALRLTQTLTDAAGLPRPQSEPLVQFSPGVETKIGRIEFD